MKDQLKTIREFFKLPVPHSPQDLGEYLAEKSKAVQAAGQLESMAESVEPVAWIRASGIEMLKLENGGCATVYASEGMSNHSSPLYAAPPAQQYEAGDIASASAQGFRDGVASVTQQEPVAWAMPKGDGTFIDVITPAEHAREEGSYTVPLFARPVAQQPQKLEDVEQYRMQMAGISTAAMGYWKEGDSIHPDYDTLALHDVAKLYAKYDALYKAQQPQARPDFTDEWTGYLKDGETPFERFLRERKDLGALTKLYQRALEENERLKAQQPQAENISAFLRSEREDWEEREPKAQAEAVQQKPKLIGWRTSDYLMETSDKDKADNWAVHNEILPIFEGDPYTKLVAAPQQAEAVPCGGRDHCGRFPFCGCGDSDSLPERDKTKSAEQQGLFRKFVVRRTDGSDAPGGKHDGCDYFVLDVTHDTHAKAALAAYAESVEETHPQLAADMRNRYELAAPQQAEAVPVVDRVYEAAKRLVDHADFQLGGVLSDKSKTRDIPSNAASKVKARHLASLRDALAKTPHQAEAGPSDVVRDAVAAEREACAALAQGYAGQVGDVAWAVASAIRGRVNAAIAQQKGQP